MSMTKYQVYRSAAILICRAWIQDAFRDRSGNVCLAQSIIDNLGYSTPSRFLPDNYCEEVRRALSRYPGFQWASLVACWSREHPWRAIERWKDMSWRNQQTVAKVLLKLALDNRPAKAVKAPHKPMAPDTSVLGGPEWALLDAELDKYARGLGLVESVK